MIDYNRQIDEQISDALRRSGRVRSDELPGLDERVGAQLLRRYVEIHAAEVALSFDGVQLTWAAQQVASPVDSGGVPPSPVDQVLASTSGKALLDSAPVGTSVSRTYWLLPLGLGLIGGLIGWYAVRDQNPRVARSLLMTGAAIQLATVCLGIVFGGVVGSLVAGIQSPAGATTWPISATGRPTFHYFGTAT